MQHIADSLSNIRYFSPRLLTALSTILTVPLTVVEAPMGCGKTVAVREFLNKENLENLWVSVLDFSDGAFWRSFCNALISSDSSDNCKIGEALLKLGVPFLADDAVRRDMALELLSGLSFKNKKILVIDDIHLLNSAPSCIEFFETLAKHHIKNLHIVIITRNIYTGDIVLPSLKGLLSHINSEILAFSKEDIRKYCDLYGWEVSNKQVDDLFNMTKGWVSGLYLLCRYHSEQAKQFESDSLFDLTKEELDNFSNMISTSILPDPLVKLLENQLFIPLSENMQQMLLSLCIFEQFTGLQADFCSLHIDDNTQRMLSTLVKQNAFVSHNSGNGLYTIHAVFRNVLLRLFKELSLEKQKAIYSRAGEWFAQEKDFLSAMEQYYLAKDFDVALAFMERDMSRHLIMEKALFFDDFFTDCSQEVLSKHPYAVAKYAFVSLFVANIEAFIKSCEWLRHYCEKLDKNDKTANILRGELEMLLALTKYNDIEAMTVHYHKAWELLARPTGLYPPEATWTMGCPSVLFMFHKDCGALKEETRKMHECMPHYYKVANQHGAGGELLFEAEALYMRGDFETAYNLCCQAETVATFHNQPGNILCALFLHARLAIVRKNTSAARQYVNKMREHIKNKQDFFLLYTIEICAARIYGLLRRADEIPAWVRNGDGDHVYAFAQGEFRLAQGRSLLLAGDFAKVIGIFNALLQVPQLQKHNLFFIYAHIFMAISYNNLNKTDDALKNLELALDSAVIDGIFMPFVENCDFLYQLLQKAIDGKQNSNIEYILNLSKPWLQHLGFKTDDVNEIPFSLSSKQYEIVKLAVNGLSSNEIAKKIGLGTNTINTHLKAAYKKCGVHSRKELRELFESKNLNNK